MKIRGFGTVFLRGRIWWIQYCFRGQVHRESSGSTKQNDAIRLLRKRQAEMGQGRLLGPCAERTTFDEIARLIENSYREKENKSLVRLKGSLANLRRFFAFDRAIDVTGDRISEYKSSRKDEDAAHATINYELATLKRALRLAKEHGRLADVPRIEMFPARNVRKGFFERPMFEAVLANLPENPAHPRDYNARDLNPALEVAFITGWRIREILSRQKHHADLEAGWLRLDPGESKNDEGRMFPLTPELREVIEQQLARTREFEKASGQIVPGLFHSRGRPIGSFRKAWIRACTLAGCPGMLVHDLRRTAVRNLIRSGIPTEVAMKMTGHKTRSVFTRYAIVDESMLREAGSRLAAFHRGVVVPIGVSRR